jgi:hypothetical protein
MAMGVALACLVWTQARASSPGGGQSDEALLALAVEPIEVDDAFELVGWEIVPPALAESWERLPRAVRRTLRELRTLQPGTNVRAELVWHALDVRRQRREVELELVQGTNLLTQRYGMDGNGANGPAPNGVPEPGHVRRVQYSLRVPPWPEQEPVELGVRVRYEDPVRPPVRVSLGLFRLSAIGGQALECCVLGQTGQAQEARRRIKRLLSDERSLGAMPGCLCGLTQLLESPDLARCRLLQRRTAEAGRELLRGALRRSTSDGPGLALALTELGLAAEREATPGAAESLYRWALDLRPGLVEPALGLKRLRSSAAAAAIEALRRAGPRILSAQHWSGSQGWTLYSNGTASMHFAAVEGWAELEIEVRGQPAEGEWPMLRARLNGGELGETVADSAQLKPWLLEGRLVDGDNVLQVEYLNDVNLADADRNAFLGDLTIRSAAGKGP